MTSGLYCYRCGNSWSSDGPAPGTCPRCGSSKYGVPTSRRAQCKGCGHVWNRTALDEACPECGRSTEDGLLKCNQCDHEWAMRGDHPPKKCPLCRSSSWNEPKMHRFSCHRCGHVWRNRSEHPVKCPSCQSKLWDSPALRLQCRRCGYRWVPRDGKTSDDVRICPSCKSSKWREAPMIRDCIGCGSAFIDSRGGSLCPSCRHSGGIMSRCGFCGFTWDTDGGRWSVCPRCGKSRTAPDDESVEFWSDGSRSLRLVHSDGCSTLYLWEGDIPVAARYLHEVLADIGVTAGQLMYMIRNPIYSETWGVLASDMSIHRDDYKDSISYFTRRLNLSEADATVLAVHFSGMGPEAIAMRFGLGITDVRRIFDRIMSAYEDSGIVVDDSIFTEDPMSMY